MLKKRNINRVMAALWLAAMTSRVGIGADEPERPVTASADACPTGGGGGGGC